MMLDHEFLTRGSLNYIINRTDNYTLIERLEFIERCGFRIVIFSSTTNIDHETLIEIKQVAEFSIPKEAINKDKTSFVSIW